MINIMNSASGEITSKMANRSIWGILGKNESPRHNFGRTVIKTYRSHVIMVWSANMEVSFVSRLNFFV